MKHSEAGQPVQSVVRALGLLRLIGAGDDGVTLKDLAAAAGLKAPTTHHLVSTLVQEGFAERVSDPTRYRLGPAALHLAGRGRRQDQELAVEQALGDLAARLPQAVITFGRRVGSDVVTVLRIDPQQPGVIERPAHRVMPPYTSATALVLQAFWPADERLGYQRHHPFDELGAGLWGSAARLDAFLRKARRQGYVLAPGKVMLPVAVPVFDFNHHLLGALGAAVTPAPDDDPDALLEQMTREVIAVARHLAEPDDRTHPE